MSSRRTVILIAAVVVGLISAYLVYNYVNSADDRARGNARTVTVLKIAKNINKGTFGSEANADGSIVKAEIPAEFKPVTAIVDPSIIQDKVAVANFATGQILVDGMFADPIDNQITFAGRVQNDCAPAGTGGSTTGQAVQCVAITISVDSIHGVAGVIVPGDLVNILVVPQSPFCSGASGNNDLNATAPPGQAPKPGGVTVCTPARYLYQSAKVLFVDKTAVPQPGEATSTGTTTSANGSATSTPNTGLITLEVPARAAQLIASINPSSFYLTLVPTNYTPEPLPALDPFLSALPGEDATQLTPYGPQGIQNSK